MNTPKIRRYDSVSTAADGSRVSLNAKFSSYQDHRWVLRKAEIINRDGRCCTNCGRSDRPLLVHHKRYAPVLWDCPDDDLQTLCDNCHKLLGHTPKGGVYYDTEGSIIVEHCPMCGCEDVASNGVDIECPRCAHKVQAIDDADVGFRQGELFGRRSA